MNLLPATLIVAAVIAAVVWLNVWNYGRRAAMTPDERAAEDEEARRDASLL